MVFDRGVEQQKGPVKGYKKTTRYRVVTERETRFELATLALARRCSTTEPFALVLANKSIILCSGHNCKCFFKNLSYRKESGGHDGNQ